MLVQISQERVQAVSVRREFADLDRLVGPDAYPVRPGADIHSSGMNIRHRQAFEAPRFRFLQRLRLRLGFGLAPPIALVLLCLAGGR